MDFTNKLFKELLADLNASGYRFFRFDSYFRNRSEIDRMKRVVLLRHDVDRSPSQAVSLARIEAGMGIFGTYYFRSKPWVFKPKAMLAINDLGHEIGYHYECLADTHGDFIKARENLKRNLSRFRQLADVQTAAMHSRPLSKWDNRLIFDKYDLSEFALTGETYRSIDHDSYLYVADSGRNWNSSRTVVWDKVDGCSIPKIEGGTRGLASYLSSNDLKIQLLIHPNRWSDNMFTWTMQLAGDLVINTAKKMILLGKRIA